MLEFVRNSRRRDERFQDRNHHQNEAASEIGLRHHQSDSGTVDLWCKEPVQTPIGTLLVAASSEGITAVDWLNVEDLALAVGHMDTNPMGTVETPNLEARQWLSEAVKQLREYFAGHRREFDLTVVVEGTDFQTDVWQALAEIPYGETRSYKDIAVRIARPAAVRAVGQANRRNPVAVVVPCHRVIGAGGQLVGYAGSQTHLKAGLLELEQQTMAAAGEVMVKGTASVAAALDE